MKQYRIGILGATGAVGREMMKVLEERKFPISELRLLAGAGSAGKRIGFMGKEHTVIQASEDAFEGLDSAWRGGERHCHALRPSNS